MVYRIATKVTEGIRVNVRTTYVQDESSPRHQYYVFAYQVEIINESTETVQLLRREWNIVDGFGNKRQVKGEGVIGRQPVIEPGMQHKYVSGCDFQTQIGRMSGYYTMVRLRDSVELQIEIPPFVMAVPSLDN